MRDAFEAGIFLLLAFGGVLALQAQSGGPVSPRIVSDGTAAGGDACSSCHGNLGEGSPDGAYPRLAGLDAAYLAGQLRAYRSGIRRHSVMEAIAKRLSEREAEAAARWFAAAAPAATPRPPADRNLVARGETIATIGAWDRNIPPCSSCHGITGLGTGSSFPALAGQWAPYLARQIHAWRLGWRRNDPMGLMRNVANYLTGPETEAVAAYYASLPPPSADEPER